MARLSMFGNNHIADMHYYYGMHHGVARVACRAYIAAFPNRQPVPTYRTFITIHRLFSEWGLRRRNLGGQGRPAALQLGNTEEEILDEVFRNPSISLRYRRRNLGRGFPQSIH
ncbi:hypothetical protein QE152_g24369 [Popillia japonica]|uniref:DUF4817 domain-containing protein n=1 Tax=Popillia japonica TaxID=7064 RepID=A0AAW1KG79_POPJA